LKDIFGVTIKAAAPLVNAQYREQGENKKIGRALSFLDVPENDSFLHPSSKEYFRCQHDENAGTVIFFMKFAPVCVAFQLCNGNLPKHTFFVEKCHRSMAGLSKKSG
jgi:hypothetical protein